MTRRTIGASTVAITAMLSFLSMSAGSALAKGVTLTLWHDSSDPPALMKVYKAYQKESGNKISFVNIPDSSFGFVTQSKWATGARPDILEWQGNDADARSMDMEKNGIDLTKLPFVKKEGTLAKLSGNVNGHTYAATLGPMLIYGVFVNKQVFAKAGLAAPKNYADLAHDCQVLKTKEPGVTPIFEAGGSSFPPQALASFDYTGQYNINAVYANQINNGKASLSAANGPFLAGLNAYNNFRTSGCFNSDAATATWAQQTDAVLTGKAAMMAEDTNSISQLDAQAGGNTKKVDKALEFVAVSATKPVANTSPDPEGTFYLPKTGSRAQQNAAVSFIKFITSHKEYQTYVDDAGSIPTLSGTKMPKRIQGLWKEAQKVSKGAGLTLNSAIPGFGNNFGNESDDLLAGQQSPSDVAGKMQVYVQQAIQELK